MPSLKLVLLGANGFIGRRLAHQLLDLAQFGAPPQHTPNQERPGAEGQGAKPEPEPEAEEDKRDESAGELHDVRKLVLFDFAIGDDLSALVKAKRKENKEREVAVVKGDICNEKLMEKVLATDGCDRVTVIHTAAALSGTCERDFELGMRVNLHANLKILELMRGLTQQLGRQQVLVFTSTDYVNCYNPYNRTHPCGEEAFRLSPVSYGIQKACVESLLCDYARRGFIDARVLRLSCVIVKPGVFDVLSYPFHGIVSQTLEGKEFKCGLPKDVKYPCAFIGTVVECLLKLASSVRGEEIGHNRVIQVPARSITPELLWSKVQQVAKRLDLPLGSVTWVPPEEGSSTVKEVNVCSEVDSSKAEALLGVGKDGPDLEEIIVDFIEHDGPSAPRPAKRPKVESKPARAPSARVSGIKAPHRW